MRTLFLLLVILGIDFAGLMVWRRKQVQERPKERPIARVFAPRGRRVVPCYIPSDSHYREPAVGRCDGPTSDYGVCKCVETGKWSPYSWGALFVPEVGTR